MELLLAVQATTQYSSCVNGLHGHEKYIYKLDKKNIIVINGGKQRHISCFKALKFLKKFKPNRVFIHDAARPNFSIKLLKNLNKYLKNYNAVIPYTKPVETILSKNKKKFKILKKENIILNQTPQCFNFKSLYELSKYNKSLVTDCPPMSKPSTLITSPST